MSIRIGVYCALLSLLFCNCKDSSGGLLGKQSGVSIDSSFYFPLGGVSQHIEVWGNSTSNPVLLFIHGGPGLSAIPYLRYFNPALAESFTICSYDQRGAWISNNVVEHPDNMTLEQHVKDALELTHLLQKRFGQSKIYLAGHDWGSIIGVNLVQQHPEEYAAYCGIGQIVNVKKSEREANQFLYEKAISRADGDCLRAMRIIVRDTNNIFLGKQRGFMEQRKFMHKYKAEEWDTTIQAKVMTDPLNLYNLNALAVSQQNTLEKLWNDYINTNFEAVTDFKVPVYIFSGEHDLCAPHARVLAYFDKIQAPKKKLFIFESSGHSPQWEEPAYFIDNMKRFVKE